MRKIELLLLFVGILCTGSALAQQTLPKQEAGKVLDAYKRSMRTFMNLEICGSSLDGPAFLLKRAENYSLDRMITISPEEQEKLGQQVFEQNEEKNQVKDDKYLPMVRDMVSKLVAYTPKPNSKYHVYIIKSDQINAFSTIGGYIYVTSALLNFVNSKDELAFVLAHEISHIAYNHVVRKEKKIAMISHVGQVFNKQQFTAIALDLNMTLSAPFDQIDEYEADRLGVDLVKKAGYDQTAFNNFFKKLEVYDRKDLLQRFTASHPTSAHRRKCLNKMIGK